ncbi:MAG: nucleotidyltransferase family protein, partial [Thaumarchaeota archaeon]|nr:nucleotidyltransferase family protein [Nitrososphaerota archaeon]
HKSKQIINYFEAKKNLKVKIDYSIEKTPLGTGGAIRKASGLIDGESFFVINGDIITNLDPRQLKSKKNSIAVVSLRTAFGLVYVVGDKVRKFEEKPRISGLLMNAGIYHLSSDIINHLPKVGNIEDTAFPVFAAKGTLTVVKYPKAFWYSIDSHKDIEECSNAMKANHYNDFLLKR